MKVNNPSILKNWWGQEGYGKDIMRVQGHCAFAGLDSGDLYYNGATTATRALQTAAAVVELISDSGNDDVAGTGALTCKVTGLDGDYALVTETFTMTGAVAVVGTQLFMRVLKVEVLTAGTGGTNAGAIDCQAVGGGQIWAEIVAG